MILGSDYIFCCQLLPYIAEPLSATDVSASNNGSNMRVAYQVYFFSETIHLLITFVSGL